MRSRLSDRHSLASLPFNGFDMSRQSPSNIDFLVRWCTLLLGLSLSYYRIKFCELNYSKIFSVSSVTLAMGESTLR